MNPRVTNLVLARDNVTETAKMNYSVISEQILAEFVKAIDNMIKAHNATHVRLSTMETRETLIDLQLHPADDARAEEINSLALIFATLEQPQNVRVGQGCFVYVVNGTRFKMEFN